MAATFAKHSWLRISLRNLLMLFTCVAIVVGLFAYYAHRREAALAAIRNVGGDIRMEMGEPSRLEKWFGSAFSRVYKVDLGKGRVDNALLAQIGVLKELRALDLSGANIDDDGARRIAHLPLQELWLQGTHITDASAATISRIKTLDFLMLNATGLSDHFLEQLEPLPSLEKLGLRGARVTGAGMKFLARHPNLKQLDVYWTKVDDLGVETLSQCHSLTTVGLSMTAITNDVFPSLDKLPNLSELDLTANRPITKEAVMAFQNKHPKCKIEW